MSTQTIGFIGLGRLGSPLAANLLDAGYAVACSARGRSDELVGKGASVPGDGSPRAVAEAADIVLTCLPSEASLEAVLSGEDGIIAAGRPTLVVELSTFAIPFKRAQRDVLRDAGGDMLDCPVSGTPPMAAAKEAVVFVSGDSEAFGRAQDVIKALTPKSIYVGEFGQATNMKYVANFLAFVHVTVAAEAMAFAGLVGLDQHLVAKLIAGSAGATSGQFNIRAPLMAERRFESALVTVDMMRKDLELITDHAEDVGASARLLNVVKDLYDEMAALGEGDSDPAKLMAVLQDRAQTSA
ncbi:MAG: 2-hydroxy-3-oxopropionate reductase [Solirubrobacterales bacterium]|nr:2-hydroxy-3-oxopropionate reductase [Solirubrobacterales bacterium]